MRADQIRIVLIGGLIAGALDIIFAISFAAYNGTAPLQLLRIVASGAFGKPALHGGVPMAVFGLAAHFGLSLAWALGYFLLARLMPRLAHHPVFYGIAYGVMVFLLMRLVVLPASAFPFPVRFKPLATALDMLSHMFLFGLPIALATRRALMRGR
ncbi:hypothetical protein [Duganella callida]|uniref:DUF1440 domain-containing protein n=1 Tax=Duganella callida TaxID=2561932 RepID=A0A4Y9S949_9BURK|nr:hypothetical protein [Duganella callida]TFW18162.1 hypothetical protein E4L98_18865 [Duganella callida]